MKNRKYQGRSILCSDQGFTLLELLVVVAIMSIAVGLVSITYSVVHNANVSKAANTLDTAFNKARIQSMAKGTEAGQLTLWIDYGTLYYTIGDPDVETPTAVNSGVIDVSYTDTNGVLFGHVDFMPEVTYRFNSAGMVIGSGYSVREFGFSYGNREVDVIFFLETGKHMTELQ